MNICPHPAARDSRAKTVADMYAKYGVKPIGEIRLAKGAVLLCYDLPDGIAVQITITEHGYVRVNGVEAK